MAYQIIDDNSLSAIVKNIAQMVSYPEPVDPAGDTDTSVVQMVQAVNQSGYDLLSLYPWQELTKSYDMSIAADTSGQTEKAFALPTDFYQWVDQTQWNSTSQWPAIGPVSPQKWKQLIVRTVLPTLSFYWQVRDNELYILAPPTDAQTLTFFYQSMAWVRDADNADLYKNRATKNGDTILIDSNLVTLLGRVKWLEMKGLDSSAAMRDFQLQFENRKGGKIGAPVLTMSRSFGFPYIQPLSNTPDTGFGS
tara:strand:- start:1865 stop:2614 length:750 start_codon:yes stop_codon:yes gene_type:complete